MAKESVKQRNLNIEVLRIIAMFLIVACHATLHLPWLLHVDSNLDFLPGWKSALAYAVVQYGQVGVSIFFIISGYFLYARHSCGNESSRLGSRCFATRSYLSLSFLLNVLTGRGYVRIDKVKTGGRPTEKIYINPKLQKVQ